MSRWLPFGVLLSSWCPACADSGESAARASPDAASGVGADAGVRPYDPQTTPSPRYTRGALLARGGGGFGLIAWARPAGEGDIYVGGTMEREVTVLSTASGAEQQIPAGNGHFLLRVDASLRAEWVFGFGSSAQADFRRFRPPAVLPDGSVVLLRQSSVALHQHTLVRLSPQGSVEWSVTPPDVGYGFLAGTSTGDVLSLGYHTTESDLDPGPGTEHPTAAGVHLARFSGTTGVLERLVPLDDPGFDEPGGLVVTQGDFPVVSGFSENGATGWLARFDPQLTRGAAGTWIQPFHRRTDVWSLHGTTGVWLLNSVEAAASPGPPSLIELATGNVTAAWPFPPVSEVWGAAPAGDAVMIRGDYYQPDAHWLQTKIPEGPFVAAFSPPDGYRWLLALDGRADIVNEMLVVGRRLFVFGNAVLEAGQTVDLDGSDGVDEHVASVKDRYLYVLELELPDE